jgi:hypothetical protein
MRRDRDAGRPAARGARPTAAGGAALVGGEIEEGVGDTCEVDGGYAEVEVDGEEEVQLQRVELGEGNAADLGPGFAKERWISNIDASV